jgi:hypothetical protein
MFIPVRMILRIKKSLFQHKGRFRSGGRKTDFRLFSGDFDVFRKKKRLAGLRRVLKKNAGCSLERRYGFLQKKESKVAVFYE